VNVQAGLGAAWAIRVVSTVLTGTEASVLAPFRQGGTSLGSAEKAGSESAKEEAIQRTRGLNMAVTQIEKGFREREFFGRFSWTMGCCRRFH